MKKADQRHRVVSLVLLLGLMLSPLQVALAYRVDPPAQLSSLGLFRTRVAVPEPARWQRLEQIGVIVLDRGPDWGLLLADEEQMESLARLGFRPLQADSLESLLNAHGQEKPWLAQSLQPQLDAARSAHERGDPVQLVLTAEQRAGLAALLAVDSDGDGLSDTQEEWWCTDLLNPDTDGDGVGDGPEVIGLKEWMQNEREGYPSSGKPFVGWPSGIVGCHDDDGDDVPDLAERWELGLNMNNPSTDWDRYNDGMELFGFDHTGAMPPTVLPPGNHPLVAAYPVIQVDVVPSTLRVEAVTELHLDTTVMTGTANTYGTSETRGASDSVADTVTWNEWQEVAVTTPGGRQSSNGENPRFLGPDASAINAAGGFPWDSGTEMVLSWCDVIPLVNRFCKVPKALKDTGKFFYEFSDWLRSRSLETLGPGGGGGGGSWGGGVQDPSDRERIIGNDPTVFSQDYASGIGGTHYEYSTQSSAWYSYQSYPVAYPAQAFIPSTTTSHGTSWGGAHTTTHTEYQEHTVSQSQQFSSQTGWTSGWARNTAHSADLTFNYRISNVGTDYARSLNDMVFNIYIGRDPHPAITCQMNNPPPDRNCNLVSLTNVFPGEMHEYATGRIWLSFEQMKAIDLGEPIYVVVDNYSMGDDDVFFQQARQGGITVMMDDGVTDGDESLEVYLIPVWKDGDKVVDVLQRYFPTRQDTEGNLLAISTPEWTSPPTWVEHPLSDASWFNLYLENLGDGSVPFSDTLAYPDSTLLMRYQVDSDRDGYSDRSEMRVLCGGHLPCPARDDPGQHPQPGLTAGFNTRRDGDEVTGRLSFLNTGDYDAYGVQATVYAPDPSVRIGDSLVGGDGRVKAATQVVLGSRVLPPGLGNWLNSTAKPYTAGGYSGESDKVFSFTAQDTGVVGGMQPITLLWDDGGVSSTLVVPGGYQSPLPLSVSQGVEVGFYTGLIVAGDSFTVPVRLPRDTFTYTVESEPYTPPVVVVSYNDPQGSHRFLTLVELPDLGSDLSPYADQMLKPLSLDIATTAPFTATGSNVTYYVFNLPDSRPIVDGHLSVDYIKDDGTVVGQQIFTQTFQPGPNLVPVTWSTAIFTETYQAEHNYNILAVVADWQGNMIQSLARPLNTFQKDPLSKAAISAATWDFGTAAQGTLLQSDMAIANTGFTPLEVYARGSDAAFATTQFAVAPASLQDIPLHLDTANLPLGPYTNTLTVRTSDPNNPTFSVPVTGDVIPGVPDTPPGSVQHPLDRDVYISGDHSVGEWITYTVTDTLGLDPVSLHPVLVYSQDYSTVWGVGKYVNCGEGAPCVPWEGATLLRDDFDVLVPGRWTFPYGTWTVSGGYLNGSNGPAGIDAWAYAGDENWTNYSLKTRIDINGQDVMVVFRSVGPNRTNEYQLWINKDGSWRPNNFSLYRCMSSSCVAIFPYTSPTPIPEYIDVQVDVFGDHLQLYLNGTKYIDIYDPTGLAAGKIGFGVIMQNQGRFDWVDVKALESYIIEQVESPPYDSARLRIPETFSGGCTYKVQYGRLLVYSGTNELTTTLRLPAAMFITGTLDAMLSEVGTGNLTFTLDVGNDGTWDWQWSGDVNMTTTLTSPDLSAAFNAYWSGHGAPFTGTLDVPVRVSMSKAGQVLLTNIQVATIGSKSRAVRLEAQDYQQVTLGLAVGESGAGALTAAADVGENGTIDWTWTGSSTYPIHLTTTDLSAAFNAYLAGRIGEVDVPVRFYLAPFLDLGLRDLDVTPVPQADTTITATDIVFSDPSPAEGETVTATITVHNNGSGDSGHLIVAGFAMVGESAEWYIGSALIENVPVSGTAQAVIPWNTDGWGGDAVLEVRVDADNHVGETNEDNNVASQPLHVRTRPDLRVAALDTVPALLHNGEAATVVATVVNAGESDATASTVRFYDGMPGNETGFGAVTLTVPAGAALTATVDWTAGPLGPHTLYAVADADAAVHEGDEGNNQGAGEFYVGIGPEVYMDSGDSPDPAFSPTLGYGYINGEPLAWGGGTLPTETVRWTADGNAGVQYRFDHLLLPAMYHLDLVLYEGDGAGRTETVWVDGFDMGTTVALTDGEVHCLSMLLDPALYVDHTITTSIRCAQLAGAVVSEQALREVQYVYLDSGPDPARDPAYSSATGYGYLNGYGSQSWGSTPAETVRTIAGNEVRYRFDNLLPGRDYQINLTLYEEDGAGRVETVWIDDLDTGYSVSLGDGLMHKISLSVPIWAYIGDGTVTVAIRRTNGNFAVVSEIALEQRTLPCAALGDDDDSLGPVIVSVVAPGQAGVAEDIPVQAQVSDAARGNHGVSSATLYYGYAAPYNSTIAGTGPGGNGDGSWSFTIPAQGSGHQGQTLHFFLLAVDGDDTPAWTVDDNGGVYYGVLIGSGWSVYLPLVMRH